MKKQNREQGICIFRKFKMKKFKEISKIEFLLLKQKRGHSRYVKIGPRDPQKKEILLKLALNTIKEREKNDYIEIAPRHRKIKC